MRSGVNWTRLKLEVEHVGKGRDEERFREARDPDEEGVGTAENRDEELLDDFVLPDDDLLELAAHRGVGAAEFFDDGFVRRAEFRLGFDSRLRHDAGGMSGELEGGPEETRHPVGSCARIRWERPRCRT
jgi:hypothetical protein